MWVTPAVNRRSCSRPVMSRPRQRSAHRQRSADLGVNGILLGHPTKLDKKNHPTSSETSPQIPLHRPVRHFICSLHESCFHYNLNIIWNWKFKKKRVNHFILSGDGIISKNLLHLFSISEISFVRKTSV